MVSEAIRCLILLRNAKIATSGGIRSGKGKNQTHSYSLCNNGILLIAFKRNALLLCSNWSSEFSFQVSDWSKWPRLEPAETFEKDWYGNIQYHIWIRKMSLLQIEYFKTKEQIQAFLDWNQLKVLSRMTLSIPLSDRILCIDNFDILHRDTFKRAFAILRAAIREFHWRWGSNLI